MKKLALALVCLVSVAFFASCDPTITNPEPTIAILSDEGCLVGGEVIDMDVVYPYGFIATSNPQTLKELSKFVVVCGSTTICDTAISGTVFNYKGEIYFTNKGITPAEIVATVTDVAGNTATATIKFDVNEEIALVPVDFEWYRLGNTQTGLQEFGLYWESNLKATHAQIKPLEGVKLFVFQPEDWENATTASQKAALFNDALEHQIPAPVYNNVSTSASATYDDVIGTITTDGELHLIHVTRCVIDDFQPAGYPIHITGETK